MSVAFTVQVAEERLAVAQRPAHLDPAAGRRFAGLAYAQVPQNAEERLARRQKWPLDAYRDLPPPLEVRILRWLVDNADQLARLDREHGWREQWHLRMLTLEPPDRAGAEALGRSLERRPRCAHSKVLFDALERLHPTSALALSRLRHLGHDEAWTALIDAAPLALGRIEGDDARRAAWLLFAEALLARGRRAKGNGLSDVERAYQALQTAGREGLWNKQVNRVFEQAVRAALPSELESGRGVDTNVVADAYRGLTRLGKWLGKNLGGREATVPFSEGVVGSAPAILPAGQIEAAFASSDRHVDEFRRAATAGGGDLEAAVVGGTLTLGGLWALSQIDRTVLDALTFSSAGHPDSFWRLRDIADGMEGSGGAATRLSGYVAEQQVALDLSRAGHEVEFPSSASQPGYDLLVDGHPVQVKCSLSADYVMGHFERYPDIPVVVNAELAEQLGDHPLVWVDHALSHSEIHETTDASVAALADFGDADGLLPIPVLSLAFAAYRNYGDLRDGHIDEGVFAQRVGVDTAGRVVGGGAGTLIGGAIGSIGGPVGAAVGAGLAGFLGSVAGGTGADAINRENVCNARDDVVTALTGFARWFQEELLSARVTALRTKRVALADWAKEASAQEWAPACVVALHAAAVEAERRAKDLNEWLTPRVSGDDFARSQAGWVALREAGRFLHPELKVRLAKVKAAMNTYQNAAQPGRAGSPALEGV